MTSDGTSGAEAPDQRVGYGKPPASTRFRKGRSGNPSGRPRGRRRQPPYEAVLGQMVTIREGGSERRVSAAEAFLLQLAKRGLDGDGPAARSTIEAIETARIKRGVDGGTGVKVIIMHIIAPGDVSPAMEALRMARVLDPYRPTARIRLEPWLVETALACLDRQLNLAEQQIVVDATRTAGRVNWPDWWSVKP